MRLENERELAEVYDILCKAAGCTSLHMSSLRLHMSSLRFALVVDYADGIFSFLRIRSTGDIIELEVPADEPEDCIAGLIRYDLPLASEHSKALVAKCILDVCSSEDVVIGSFCLPAGSTVEQLLVKNDLEDTSYGSR